MVGEFFRHRGQPVVMRERPAIVYRHGLTFEIAVLTQAAPKRGYQMRALIGCSRAEEPDDRQRRGLCPRRQGPPRRRASKQRDELAAVQ